MKKRKEKLILSFLSSICQGKMKRRRGKGRRKKEEDQGRYRTGGRPSNAKRTPETKRTHPSVSGRKTFHPNRIS